MSIKFANEKELLETLLDRVKEFVGSNKDVAAAKALDIGSSTISTWRKRGGHSNDPFIDFAYENALSFDWLFYGKEPMMIDDAVEELVINEFDSFDQEALEIAIECIELYINKLDLKVSPAKKAKVIRMLYPIIRDDEENEVPDNVIDLLKLAAEVEEEGNNNEQKEQMADGHEGTGRRKISLD